MPGPLQKGNPILVVVWVLVTVFVLSVITVLWKSRTSIDERERVRALVLTRLVAEHAASRFDLTNNTLLSAIDHLLPADFTGARTLPETRRATIETILKKQQIRNKGVVSMSLTDADGYVFANTVGTPPGVSLADRKYFLDLKAGAPQPVVSDAIKGRVSNRWGVQVARRFNFPDGAFAGMLVANLGLEESFDTFYRGVGTEPDMFITLRTVNNQILVRYPPVDERRGTVLSGSAATSRVLSGVDQQIVDSVSPIDGIDRVVGLQKLSGYPVIASVGLSKKQIFAGWQEQLVLAVILVCAVLLTGYFATLTIRRRDRASNELEAAHDELKVLHDELSASQVKLSGALAAAENSALFDELTGLANRRSFNLRLSDSISRSLRFRNPFCLLMLDLDHFKRINDFYGHQVGDSVLREFATLVADRTRESDLAARWGGEEFMILLEGADLEKATRVAEEICAAVRNHKFSQIKGITVSIGIAEYLISDDDQAMLSRVDKALYEAKSGGRDCVCH